MAEPTTKRSWPKRIALVLGLLLLGAGVGAFAISRADGPWWVFHGGPFRSGELVALDAIDWEGLDALHVLEMEIVGEESSLTLWFSVNEGVPYVACDLDCVGGRLNRWPQQIAKDDRVVIRIDGKRAEARLVHVPHGTEEYALARTVRDRKYAGEKDAGAAVETAAHGAVVGVGEVLTGRDQLEEPGDRMFRVAPREATEG